MKNYAISPESLPNINQIIPTEYGHSAMAMKSGATAHHYKSPGKIFPTSVCEKIYEALIPVTSSSFNADMTSYWANRKQHDYFGRLTELVLVSDTQGKFIAWSGFSAIIEPACTIIYNDSSGTIPAWQGRGIMTEIFSRRITSCLTEFNRENIPLYFSTRTESPIIYKMRQCLMTHLYPNPSEPVPERILNHAKILAAWLGQADKLEPGTLIIRNAYAMVDNLYGEMPTSSDPELDNWVYGQLHPVDAFLLMGEIDQQP